MTRQDLTIFEHFRIRRHFDEESEKWVQQRMMGQETRNKLTDYWKDHKIQEGNEFAILTNIIHSEWSGLSVKEHETMLSLKQII